MESGKESSSVQYVPCIFILLFVLSVAYSVFLLCMLSFVDVCIFLCEVTEFMLKSMQISGAHLSSDQECTNTVRQPVHSEKHQNLESES